MAAKSSAAKATEAAEPNAEATADSTAEATTEAKIESTVQAVAKKKYDFSKLNILSVVSLGFAVIGGTIPAVVLAHISLSQIKKNPQDGRVLAIIAMVLGYIQVTFFVFGGLFALGMAIVALTQGVPLTGLEHYFQMNGWGGDMDGRGMMNW